ncbi:MAG: hypothetical protein ACTHVM_03140 [Alkalibacterium gilvum]|uniref:Uncharacterized protein n=1 Tax=Alkalibacterium gilvum TaxID=1130080 RepID=A0A1H6RWW8_9LACT|nr:hypothetical protein [Alkalibacterium gilvum]SEI57984.1 hypothetical protein SAMN04488113_10428 [Alkalibacterium gilvum]
MQKKLTKFIIWQSIEPPENTFSKILTGVFWLFTVFLISMFSVFVYGLEINMVIRVLLIAYLVLNILFTGSAWEIAGYENKDFSARRWFVFGKYAFPFYLWYAVYYLKNPEKFSLNNSK